MNCPQANCSGSIVNGRCTKCHGADALVQGPSSDFKAEEDSNALPSRADAVIATPRRSTSELGIKPQLAIERVEAEARPDAIALLITSSVDEAEREALKLKLQQWESAVPGSYEQWCAQAEIFKIAIHELVTREILPEPLIKLFGVSLVEDPLRRAAEHAYRKCAYLAQSTEKRIEHVDEANSIREESWF